MNRTRFTPRCLTLANPSDYLRRHLPRTTYGTEQQHMPEASVAPAWAIPGYLEAREGRLFIEGVDSTALAREHDTPLFVFSERRVRSNVERLRRAAARVGHALRFFYALKG